MIVLDTDHFSLLEWSRGAESARLREKLEKISSEDVAVSIISFEEQTRGWLSVVAQAKTREDVVESYRKLKRHLTIYRRAIVLDFDQKAQTIFESLQKKKIRIGNMDLRIASIVLSHNDLLLTRNLRHFSQVPGLKVEDWTK
jgi:tRNA(fMet)-specific endonuclease VapC